MSPQPHPATSTGRKQAGALPTASEPHPLDCEDCGDDPEGRRIRCFHCGLLVCGWCWHHVHRCEPGHTRAECRSLRRYLARPVGAVRLAWVERLRGRTLHLCAIGAKTLHQPPPAVPAEARP